MILSIVTGTFNRLSYLQALVESCRKSLPPNWVPGVDYEFSICDGGSTDGTLDWLKTQPGVTLVEHGDLKGAIKAFNDAGAAAKGDYLAILNDDIVVQGYTLARGLSIMMDNPEIGAGCFYQDRNNKELHVEKMPIYRGGEPLWEPYMQCGLIPRWLWAQCGGWGDWGGRTYGGDNYISGKVYESGYKVVALEGCSISDKVAADELRLKNNSNNRDGQILWSKFPAFKIPDSPIYKNPLPERKRVLYAPIIEAGHDIQKKLKRGLRDALGALGLVWEVDYVYSKESVKEAAEVWRPHIVLTQFHNAGSTTPEDVAILNASCQEHMINWNGDVWPNQADPEMMNILRYYDIHTTVNAALLPKYAACGIRAAYWQNSFEPGVLETPEYPVLVTADAVFVGNNYSEYRIGLAQMLKGLPFNIQIYGRGYPPGLSEGESLYDYRKTGLLYRTSKIGIADNQFYEATGFFSDRAFMIMAAGGCLMLHQEVQEMEKLGGFVDGVHYVSWKNQADLKAKIAYYLEHEEERKKIADAGTAYCRACHSFEARARELQGLITQLPKRTKTVSALVICKDEGHNIERTLKQLEWADEIIVVDTGSTDDTLARMGVPPDAGEWVDDQSLMYSAGKLRVYSFPWVDDFSAARNFAKSKATGDFCFWLDCDDIIPEATLARLRKFTTWSFRSLGVQDPGAFRFWVETAGQGVFQTRLFKNVPLVEWRRRVHETVDESLMEMGITSVAMTEMRIDHEKAPKEALQAKQMRNLRLLGYEMDTPWRKYQMASSFAAMERWGDAAIFFELAERATDDKEFRGFLGFAAGYAFYKMGLSDMALIKFRQSDYPDALYLRAELENSPAVLSSFLNTSASTLFPSYSRAWRTEARKKLTDWHRQELEKLLV